MSRTQRVIVLFWDGMRPDHVRPDLTPNLWGLAQDGAWYREAVGVFPTITHPNMASLSTGCYPGKHGVHTNELPGYPGDRRPIMTNVREDLERLRGVNGGRVLPVKTLAEALVEAGKRVVTLGSGPYGHGTLFDPERAAVSIHTMFAWPEELRDKVAERFGTPPQKAVSQRGTDEWITDVLLGYVLPELEPDAVLVYSCEPDLTQHAKGLGSPEALAVTRGNDALLGRILAAVEHDGVPTSVVVVSDHGHSTVGGFFDLTKELEDDGFARELDEGLLVCGHFGNQLTVEDHPGAPALAERVGAWLAGRPWVDALFGWSEDDAASTAGAIPARVLWNDRPPRAFETAATFMFPPTWGGEANGYGVPGTELSRAHVVAGFKRNPGTVVGLSNELVSMHGSLSPYDLNVTLVLSGAGIRSGRLDLPAGVVDVAPTVLALLGLPPLPEADGRALAESLEGGPDPASTEAQEEHVADLRSGLLRRCWIDGTAYLAARAEEEAHTTAGIGQTGRPLGAK